MSTDTPEGTHERSIRGYVQDAGGGLVTVMVYRDTESYPPIGASISMTVYDPAERGCGVSGSTSAFQAEGTGSNPATRSELHHELAEARSEIARHHRDFAQISQIVGDALRGTIGSDFALRSIRGISG